jgi:hypothetical protein
MTYRPGGAHPTAYLRVYLLAEMMRRMGFAGDATRLLRVWQGLYRANTGHRIPPPLMSSAPRIIPEVVDEIAFQTRRNLAQRALVDVIPFRREDEEAIRAGARRLAEGRDAALPPRHLVSAAHHALEAGRIAPQRLAHLVIDLLTHHLQATRSEHTPLREAA